MNKDNIEFELYLTMTEVDYILDFEVESELTEEWQEWAHRLYGYAHRVQDIIERALGYDEESLREE